jgi:hypothetical protein
MDLRDKLVYAFNTFFGDFLTNAKNVDESIKKRLKKKYRVIDRSSNAILLDFCKAAKSSGIYDIIRDVSEPDKLLDTESVLSMHVAQAMPLKDVLQFAKDDTKKCILSDISLLCGVCSIYDELCDEDHSDTSVLQSFFENLMEAVENVTSGINSYSDVDIMKSIVDDDVRDLFVGILARVHRSKSESNNKNGKSPVYNDNSENVNPKSNEMEDILEQMKSSKLGEIAEEISKTIDKDKLAQAFSGENGMENMIQGLMSGKNVGMIGELIQQVGDKINKKLQDGDMKEEDLLKDAFSLMGRMKDFGSGKK